MRGPKVGRQAQNWSDAEPVLVQSAFLAKEVFWRRGGQSEKRAVAGLAERSEHKGGALRSAVLSSAYVFSSSSR